MWEREWWLPSGVTLAELKATNPQKFIIICILKIYNYILTVADCELIMWNKPIYPFKQKHQRDSDLLRPTVPAGRPRWRTRDFFPLRPRDPSPQNLHDSHGKQNINIYILFFCLLHTNIHTYRKHTFKHIKTNKTSCFSETKHYFYTLSL